MTKKRAHEILVTQTSMGSLKYAFVGRRGVSSKDSPLFDPNGITESEDVEIRDIWQKMPGHKSYRDAIVRIARKVGTNGI